MAAVREAIAAAPPGFSEQATEGAAQSRSTRPVMAPARRFASGFAHVAVRRHQAGRRRQRLGAAQAVAPQSGQLRGRTLGWTCPSRPARSLRRAEERRGRHPQIPRHRPQRRGLVDAARRPGGPPAARPRPARRPGRSSTSSTPAAAPAASPSRWPSSATGSPSSTPAPTRWPRSTGAPPRPASQTDQRRPGRRGRPARGRRPEAYDVVLCHGVLEVVDDPAAALAAMVRVLRPGGLLSVLVANVNGAVLARAVAGRLDEAVDAARGRRRPRRARTTRCVRRFDRPRSPRPARPGRPRGRGAARRPGLQRPGPRLAARPRPGGGRGAASARASSSPAGPSSPHVAAAAARARRRRARSPLTRLSRSQP